MVFDCLWLLFGGTGLDLLCCFSFVVFDCIWLFGVVFDLLFGFGLLMDVFGCFLPGVLAVVWLCLLVW